MHTEIDKAARERIIEDKNKRYETKELPQEKELDFSGDFDEARRNAWGWDPESMREYEIFTEEYNAERDADWQPRDDCDQWER